jgi:hypothetical protein
MMTFEDGDSRGAAGGVKDGPRVHERRVKDGVRRKAGAVAAWCEPGAQRDAAQSQAARDAGAEAERPAAVHAHAVAVEAVVRRRRKRAARAQVYSCQRRGTVSSPPHDLCPLRAPCPMLVSKHAA